MSRIGNVEAEKLICATHGHELRGVENVGRWRVCWVEENKGENGTTAIA